MARKVTLCGQMQAIQRLRQARTLKPMIDHLVTEENSTSRRSYESKSSRRGSFSCSQTRSIFAPDQQCSPMRQTMRDSPVNVPTTRKIHLCPACSRPCTLLLIAVASCRQAQSCNPSRILFLTQISLRLFDACVMRSRTTANH